MNPVNDKEKILIVDDTSTTLNMLREGLEETGYKVYVATSGEKALKRARQLMPDLILLDVLMPAMDGFQTCRQLKADKTTREIPVIFMTALSAAEKIVRAFKVGAVDYVTKPIEIEEVLVRIETHLSLHRFSKGLESLVEARTAELKESQENFHAVANYTYDWESWIDSEGKTKWINPAVERITGYSVDECMEMVNYPLLLVHEEDRNQVADIMKEALNGSSGNDKAFRIVAKNGSIRWVTMSWQPIYDSNGKSLGYRSSVCDVTERKRTEQEILLLSFALDNVREGAFLIDENACFHYVNEESCRILCYTREELLNMGVSDVDPDWPDERWPEHWNELRKQRSLIFEGRHRTKDGRIFPVEVNANYFEYGGKSYNLALVRDITERKQAEKMLTVKERELRTLLDNYPDHIVRIDRECRFLYISPVVARAFNLSPLDTIGKRLEELPMTQTSEQIELLNAGIKQAFEQKASNTLEATWITDKGPQIFEVRHVPELDEHGEVVSVIGITRNITERKRSEEVLRQLNRKLIAISECNQALLKAEDEQTLLNDICHIVCDKAGYHVAWVGFVEHDSDKTIRPVAWAGEGSEYIVNTRLSWSETSEYGQGLAGKSIRSGEVIHIQDFKTDPSMASWRKSAMEHDYRSGVGMPLKDEKNEIFGIFMIYSSQPNIFVSGEIKLLQELAGDLAYGVVALRIRAEHERIEKALSASEAEMRALINAMTDNVFVCNSEGRYLKIVDTSSSLLYKPSKELLGKTLHEVFPKEQADFLLAPVLQALETQKPVNYEYSLPIGDKVFWFNATCSPLSDDKTLMVARDISERKKAEETLRASEEHFRTVVQNSPVIVFSIDHNGIFTLSEGKGLKELGLAPGEVVGKSIYEIYSHNPEIIKNFNRALAGEDFVYIDEEEGHVYETRWTHIRGDTGEESRIIGVSVDITERKQAEAALQEAAIKYKIVADNTYDWEFWQNPEGEYVYVSPSSKRITGYEANEFLVDSSLMDRIVHPGDRSSLAEHRHDMEQNRCPGELEYRIIHTDGTIHWISHLCQPVFDDKGNFMGMRGSNRDITDRKRADIEIKRINRILRMLSDTNQALIHIPDETSLLNEVCRIAVDVGGYRMVWVGFVEHDEAKTVRPMAQVGFNPGYLESAGISWEDTDDEHSSPCGIAIRTGKPKLIRYILSDPALSAWKDAAVRCGYQSVLALPLISEGKAFGALGIYSDEEDVFDSNEVDILKELADDLAFGISALQIRKERNRAEMDREKLLRDLNAKNKELQSIVYISSHDLKTPLVNIKGFSRLLDEHCREIADLVSQGDFSDDNKQKINLLLREDVPEDLAFVSSSADRMNEMIEGLLRVSRIGVSEIQMREIDMNKMVSKIVDLVKYPIDATQTDIVIDALPDCISDEEMLKQLFSNLIDNAIKYLDPDRKGRIHISGRVEGGNYIYCVEDNGIGISPEHQSKIFELYHRLNPETTIEGEGLGLTIVTRIMDKLNGRIQVESELGKGSKFFVSLPSPANQASSDILRM